MEDNKNKKVPNVPTLRFPEFSGEWKLTNLNNLYFSYNSLSGKNKIDFENGNSKYVTYLNVFENVKIKKIFSKVRVSNDELQNSISNNDMFVTLSSETPEEVAISSCLDFKIDENIYLNSFCFGLRPKVEVNSLFTAYMIRSPKLRKRIFPLAQGSTRFNLNKEHFLEKLKIYICNKKEQSKIANFLSLIDKRIELQNKIIRDYELLKKLLMNEFLIKFNLKETSIHSLLKSQTIRIIKAHELKKFDGTKSYLSTSSINENGLISPEKEISFFDRPSRASMIPYKNSVWFAKMKNTNKVYISKNNDEGKYILSTGFYGVFPIKNDIDPVWLFEIFKSNYFITQKDKLSEGGTMSGIKDSQLNELNIKIWINRSTQNVACKLLTSFTKIIKYELTKENQLKKLKHFILKTLFI